MTSAYEAKRRIVALLAAAPALAGVRVSRSAPSHRDELTDEMVYVGQVTPAAWAAGDQEPRTLGDTRRTERFTVDLTVTNFTTGGTEAACEDRNEQLVDAVERGLFADNSLGGLLAIGGWVSGLELDTRPVGDPRGWQSTARLRFECQSVIRP